MRPRIRSIKPEMWHDERIGRLSHGARLLFIGLITMADDEGRFRALTQGICGHVFQYEDDAPRKLRGWVRELQETGMVVFYVVDGVPYGAFRHWKRHQKVNRPTPSDLPPPPDQAIASENSVNGHGSLTEDSVSNHGAFTPSRAGARSDPDPIVVRLTERLAARVRANDPKANPDPHSERWLTDMRLLLKDRNGDVAEIERIIDWCQSDPFWQSNILSPGKLRAQFTQLLLKAKPHLAAVTPKHERQSERLAALERLTGGAA